MLAPRHSGYVHALVSVCDVKHDAQLDRFRIQRSHLSPIDVGRLDRLVLHLGLIFYALEDSRQCASTLRPRESMLQLLPRFEGEVGNPAMVGMVIDEPVSEDGIGIFLLDDALKLLVVLVVNDRMTIDLIGICRAGFQNLARLFSFGNASRRRRLLPSPVVHVEQHHIVAQR